MLPKDLNYYMPAEWSAHQRTLVSWPVHQSMCFPQDYAAVCKGYRDIIAAIAEFEPVTVVVNPGENERVKAILNHSQVEVLAIPHNDAWLRDNGPTFLRNAAGRLAGVNWEFNAWGGKYQPWDLDDQVAPHILEHFGVRRFDAPLVLEGGSIHTDGEGTLLTTEECLLNPNRNPGMTRTQIEHHLNNYLSIEKVIWLNKGLEGDETDGHVDNAACFAAPGKVLIQVCDDVDDANYHTSQENLGILKNAIDAQGRKFEIIPIPQPPRMEVEGQRLTLSYLNFYFVNGGIILPVFGGPARDTDRQAQEVLMTVFPDRKIRKIDGLSIVKEGGNVHCMTQQMPARKN